MILTVDLGTSVTKVVVWGDDGPVATGRSPVHTSYLAGGRVEQDPEAWWASLVAACALCSGAGGGSAGGSGAGGSGAGGSGAGGSGRNGGNRGDGIDKRGVMRDVRAIAFAAARQTIVPVAADGTTLGPAIVWSDRRAGHEADAIAHARGRHRAGPAADDSRGPGRVRVGVRPDAGSVAAKVAWLAGNEPDRLRSARWLLGPRDLLAWRLTGSVATDWSMASATGLYEHSTENADDDAPIQLDAELVEHLPDGVADMLPTPLSSHAVAGELLPRAADELGLPAGVPVVIGAGDRACEVLGTGASPRRPMVSWGTTANVSVPVDELPAVVPEGLIVTRGCDGWLLEGGLAAAGSLADWLSRLTGIDIETVAHHAATSPPGANGVVVLPWFGGARAPWWRDGARGAIVGLALEHRLGDVARAVVEAVAWDVTRCLETAAQVKAPDGRKGLSERTGFDGMVLGGGGAAVALWTEIVTAVAGLPATRRRSGEAASAGAALLAGLAIGSGAELDRLDPVGADIAPDPRAEAAYRERRAVVDAAAEAVIALDFGTAGASPSSESSGRARD